MIYHQVEAQHTNKTEINMLKYAQIPNLLTPHSISKTTVDHICVEYFSQDACVSIFDYTQSNRIQINFIMDFLDALYEVKRQMQFHLLNTESLHFNLEMIFYEKNLHRFYFTYGFKANKTIIDELTCMRHLISESNLSAKQKQFIGENALTLSTYHLDCFYDSLKKIYEAKRPKHFPVFIKKSRMMIPPNTSACLISKVSPYTVYTIRSQNTSIGSSEKNDIQILSDGIESMHAEIKFIHQQFWISRKSKNNKLMLNQKTISKKSKLQNGDLLSFGNKDYVFIL